MVSPPAIPISSICSDWAFPPKDPQGEGSTSTIGDSSVVSSNLVPSTPGYVELPKETATSSSSSTRSLGRTSPSHTTGSSDSSRLAYLRKSLSEQGISEAATIICSFWRTRTSKVYNSCWNKWVSWCDTWKVNPISTTSQTVLFLTELFQEGKEYSTINSYRSAISVSHVPVENARVGQHPTLIRFMQGIFNSRPPKPRYNAVLKN